MSRYTADGVLDMEFGTAGSAVLALPNRECGNAIVATGDGKLVVGGRSHISGEGPDLLLARFWEDSGVPVPETPQQGDALSVFPCPVTTSFTMAGTAPFTGTNTVAIVDGGSGCHRACGDDCDAAIQQGQQQEHQQHGVQAEAHQDFLTGYRRHCVASRMSARQRCR